MEIFLGSGEIGPGKKKKSTTWKMLHALFCTHNNLHL